jgi:septal ring factor EnvC (AmiA/AmiB activator)
MGKRSSDRRVVAGAVLIAAAALAGRALPAEGDARGNRVRAMQEEILRLRTEMESLGERENGLLGEVARLGALLRLRDREAQEAALRLEDVRAGLLERETRVAALKTAQGERERLLRSRLREIYKRGTDLEVRRLLGGPSAEAYLDGLRFASYLNDRDARLLASWRADEGRLRSEAEALAGEERSLDRVRQEAEKARAELARSSAERSRLLESIRSDRAKHQEAIEDLERAARELGRLVETLGGAATGPALDVRKFRGLLDWPAEGRVSEDFGDAVHPRFRTVVPHPGLDIDAPEGASFRSVFDGRVAFASWLHGYGLTAVVDHGNGVVSIYAHAASLLAGAGDEVTRGQDLGRVGDTGSLRGPYLYFELRKDGKPVDPGSWLRRK